MLFDLAVGHVDAESVLDCAWVAIPAIRAQSSARTTGYTSPSVDEPFRVTFTGQGIDVAGRLATIESADEFVGAINALKPLLRRVDEMKGRDEDEAAN
jgi:hypothetical protein